MSPAARNRLASLAASALVVATVRALVPDGARRAELLYAFVAALGYGHLLGAAASARDRLRERLPHDAARAAALAFAALSLATLFALYLEALARAPAAALLLLLGLSAWHAAENDGALAGAYASGLRLGPIARDARLHARALAVAAALAALFGAARGADAFAPALRGASFAGALPLDVAEVFALFGLQHLASWLVLLGERAVALARAGRGPEARRLALRVAGTHAAAGAASLAALLAPAGTAPALRAWLLSPAVYLFASALHVLHTAVARGIEPRRGAR